MVMILAVFLNGGEVGGFLWKRDGLCMPDVDAGFEAMSEERERGLGWVVCQ
jgi:hypothetical protein